MVFTSRSAGARQAILTAARRQFGEDGFERTTVRSVATEAAVDPAMVMRYYGSKDGLFASAVDIDLGLPDLQLIALPDMGRTLAARFVDLWEGAHANPALQILLRSAGSTPAAQERVREIFEQQVQATVRGALSAEGRSEVAALVAARIGSYVLGTAFVRYTLRFGPIVALTSDELASEMAGVLQRLFEI